MNNGTIERISFTVLKLVIAGLVAYALIILGLENPAPPKIPNDPTYFISSATVAEAVSIEAKPEIDSYRNVLITAKSAIVYDIETGTILYSKNKDDLLPIASITKLMTAYTASQMIPKNSIITISQKAANLENSAGLMSGEHWTMNDLIAFTLVSSSNGGASAIAETAQDETQINFISKMNELSAQIGLQNTLFRNETGLDMFDDQISGSYSTALDIGRLYSHIFKNDPDLLSETNKSWLTKFSMENIRHEISNTNQMIERIPNLISSKTGTTDLAGGNLAVIFEPVPGRPVVAVILGSSSQGRFTDMESLVTATLDQVR